MRGRFPGQLARRCRQDSYRLIPFLPPSAPQALLALSSTAPLYLVQLDSRVYLLQSLLLTLRPLLRPPMPLQLLCASQPLANMLSSETRRALLRSVPGFLPFPMRVLLQGTNIRAVATSCRKTLGSRIFLATSQTPPSTVSLIRESCLKENSSAESICDADDNDNDANGDHGAKTRKSNSGTSCM